MMWLIFVKVESQGTASAEESELIMYRLTAIFIDQYDMPLTRA